MDEYDLDTVMEGMDGANDPASEFVVPYALLQLEADLNKLGRPSELAVLGRSPRTPKKYGFAVPVTVCLLLPLAEGFCNFSRDNFCTGL